MNRRWMLAIAAVATLSGCAFLRDLLRESGGAPSATLRSADVTDASLTSATLTLRFAVENPGVVPVRITAVDYAFTVDGKPQPVPAPATGQTIQPGAVLELAFPARLTFPEVAGSAADTARYAASGAVTLASATGPLRLPLEHQGALERPRRPIATLGMPHFGAPSDDDRASIELPLTIENPNAFALPLSLSGGFSVFGVQVAAIGANDLGTLGAREKRELSIPLSYDLPAAALKALQLALVRPAPSAPLAFDGVLQSGSTKLPLQWTHALRLPSLSIAGTSFTDWSLEGVTLNVLLDTDNPEDAPLALSDVRTALTVNGKPAAALVPAPPRASAGAGKSRVALPIRFQFADTAAALLSVLQQKTASFAFTGSVGVPTALGVIPLPLKEQGRFTLPQLPKIAFRSPRVADLSLTQATLELPLDVTNPNPFELPVSAVQGAVALAGVKLGALSTGDLGKLPASGTRSVSLPVSFELLKAAKAAAAVRSGSAPLAFDGAVQTGALAVPVKWAQTVAITR